MYDLHDLFDIWSMDRTAQTYTALLFFLVFQGAQYSIYLIIDMLSRYLRRHFFIASFNGSDDRLML